MTHSFDLKTAFRDAVHWLPIALMIAAMAVLSACSTSSLTQGLQPPSPGATATVGAAPRPPQALAGQPAPRGQTALAAESENSSGAVAALEANQPVATLPPVAFLPVTGAPRSTVSELAGAIRDAAQVESVPIVISVDQGAQYQVKGYFSALNDANGTLLIYVWDVLDRNGTRVHRISGQERGRRAAGDPWAGVTPQVIDSVARTTMSSLRGWVAGRTAG